MHVQNANSDATSPLLQGAGLLLPQVHCSLGSRNRAAHSENPGHHQTCSVCKIQRYSLITRFTLVYVCMNVSTYIQYPGCTYIQVLTYCIVCVFVCTCVQVCVHTYTLVYFGCWSQPLTYVLINVCVGDVFLNKIYCNNL